MDYALVLVCTVLTYNVLWTFLCSPDLNHLGVFTFFKHFLMVCCWRSHIFWFIIAVPKTGFQFPWGIITCFHLLGRACYQDSCVSGKSQNVVWYFLLSPLSDTLHRGSMSLWNFATHFSNNMASHTRSVKSLMILEDDNESCRLLNRDGTGRTLFI